MRPPETGRASPLLRDEAAIEALKSAGYVVYVRHGETDSNNDNDVERLENCATQRNLTPRGEEQSRQMGAAIRRLAIPVSAIAAGPFCRTRHTAEQAFGSSPLEAALTYYGAMPAVRLQATHDFVRRLQHEDVTPGELAIEPADGPVEWLVWRDGLDSAFRSMEPDEVWAFDAAMAGASFADLCEGFCEFHQPQEAAARRAALLRMWIETGLLKRNPDLA